MISCGGKDYKVVIMSGVSKAISEELLDAVEKALSVSIKQGDVSRKLQAIKSAKKHGIKLVADVFDVSRVSILQWVKSFAANGVEGLKLKVGRGRNSILSDAEKAKVREWIDEDCNVTIKEIQLRIEAVFNKTLKKSAAYNLMKSLGFSYITPRPSHYKQDKTRVEEFKKKSTGDKA
jgi:transposase